METFFELIIDFVKDAHKDMVATKGYSPHRLNVFVDLVTAKLVFQYVFLDLKREYVEKETAESNKDFLIFYKAYEQLEADMKADGQRIEFCDVIFRMEHYFLDYVLNYGYDRNVLFSIVYVPMVKEVNPLEIPSELLQPLGDKILRN